jgi:hypothetical protein
VEHHPRDRTALHRPFQFRDPSPTWKIIAFDEDAAVELFVKSAKLGSLSPAEQGYVDAIVRELCCLSLAVNQAGSSIATGNSI